jgi:von Willebrand factor type A domain
MSPRSLVTAAIAVVASASCNERPVYRTGPSLEGGGTTAGRDSGPPPDAPPFTLPDPPSAPANPSADARACGFEKFALERVPPSLMLVLDRSGSMGRDAVGAPAGATLWTETLTAMDEVVRGTQATVKWGLKLFPLPARCTVADGAEVAIAPNNYDMVLSRARTTGISENNQGVGTPTATAMQKAVAYLQTVADPHRKYIVLATDGEPNCPDEETGPDLAVQAVLSAANAGFRVYVIGIAISAAGTTTLNRMAEAGGAPRTDPNLRFYPVANRMDLTTALGEIAGQIASCSFNLSKPPPAPDSVKVTVDGEPVPQSGSDGWSYSSPQNTSIQLNGSWCERLKAKAGQVDIVLGCPGIVVP